MPYLLRLIVPDRPGMLGAVATALGAAGADIVGLDVVERGPDGAVDDVMVQLPPGGLPDSLITSARSVPGVVVESLRPYLGADDLHRDLELVDEIAARPAEALDLLLSAIPGVFRAGWAMLVDASAPDCLRLASASAPQPPPGLAGLLPVPRGTCVSVDSPWVPETWRALGTELAATPLGTDGCAVLVGRVGGPRWRAGELARLEHLAGITATVRSPR